MTLSMTFILFHPASLPLSLLFLRANYGSFWLILPIYMSILKLKSVISDPVSLNYSLIHGIFFVISNIKIIFNYIEKS